MRIVRIIGMALLCFAPLTVTGFAQSSGSIITVAGNGTAGFSGDGGPAISAEINQAEGVGGDLGGNFYIADTENNRIRRVAPDGVISTVAGTGFRGFSGDGGPAVEATLHMPTDVAADPEGNLYIADFYNGRVRKVTPGGIISTLASIDAPYRITLDETGNLYVVQDLGRLAPTGETSKVFKVTPAGAKTIVAGGGTLPYQDGLPATSVLLEWMTGIAIGPEGDIYIALSSNGRIVRMFNGTLYTVAGGGTQYPEEGKPAFLVQMTPVGLAFDPYGSPYTIDWNSSRVLKVTSQSRIAVVAGNGQVGFNGDDGPAVLAELSGPVDVAFDFRGKLLIADRGNQRIRRAAIDPSYAVTYFPQLAVGSGWTTLFTLVNTGTAAATGDVIIRDPAGNPLTVSAELTDSSGIKHPQSSSFFSFEIPSGGTILLSAAAADLIKTGWAQLESIGGSIQGIVTYEYTGSASRESIVSVPQSAPTLNATVPVLNDTVVGKQIAYAIANPNSQGISVEMVLMAQNGTVASSSVTLVLGPGEQKAGYLWQKLGVSNFKGSLAFSGRDGKAFVVFALLDKQGLLTAVPAIVP